MEGIKKEKNYGIELLRIVAIVFVLILHIFGRGGVAPYAGLASNLEAHPWNYKVSWIFESAVYGCVDIFALISGFVGLRSKFHIKKWLKLWVVVVFWGTMLYLIFDKCTFIFDGFNNLLCKIIPAMKPGVEAFGAETKLYINAIFTVGTKQFWYFNMYTLLFFFMPLLNAAVSKLTKKQLGAITFTLFVLMSAYNTVVDKDIFVLVNGYTAMWLIFLYVVGATVKRFYEDGFRPNKLACLLGYLGCTAITAGFRFLFDWLYKKYPEKEMFHESNDLLISYTGPFIVIGSVLLLFIFMQMDVRSKAGRKITLFFSGASFGIYIIQVHDTMWVNLLHYRYSKFAYEPTGKMLLYVFIVLVALYILFAAMELARIYLFKLLRLDKLIELIGNGIMKLIGKIYLDRAPKAAALEEGSAPAPAEETPPNETK